MSETLIPRTENTRSGQATYKWKCWREDSPVKGWDEWRWYPGGYSDNEDGFWARIYVHVDGPPNPHLYREIAIVPSGRIAENICESRNAT